MKKAHIGTALALLAALTALAFVSCEDAATPEDTAITGTVGIIFPNTYTRWQNDAARFESEFEGYGVEYTILYGNDNTATEAEHVQTLIESGVSVLIYCPYSSADAAPAVEAAKAAGMTVIAYDRLLTETDAVDYYVTFDSITVGETMAQYLVDHATGSGMPLYLYAGHPSDNNSYLFFEGSWSVLQPKIADGTFVIANSAAADTLKASATLTREQLESIVGTNAISGDVMTVDGITTHWNGADAETLTSLNLAAAGAGLKGDIAVLAPNDNTARGIIAALEADTDVDSYIITGQDAELQSVQSIIDGKQSMTVFKDTRTLASDATAAAIAILKGNAPATVASYDNGVKEVPAVQSPVVTVTADNVQEALIDTGYYSATDFTGL